MPACVIPVGPEWQDPLGNPNLPPRIVASNPPEGMPAVGLNNTATFQITITDPNPGETLHIKWLAEFPPFVENVTRPLPNAMNMQPAPVAGSRHPITEVFDCNAFNPAITDHRVTVFVADSAFKPGVFGDPLALEDANGEMDSRFWTLNLTCQSGTAP